MSRPLGVHLAQCQVPGENQESLLWVWWGRDRGGDRARARPHGHTESRSVRKENEVVLSYRWQFQNGRSKGPGLGLSIQLTSVSPHGLAQEKKLGELHCLSFELI